MKSNNVNIKNRQGVGLLNKTFFILNLFTLKNPSWTQAQLIKQTQIPKATMSRLIGFLCDTGYLTLAIKGHYSLGPAAIDIGRRASASFDICTFSLPVIQALSEQTGETILLMALHENRKKVISLSQIPSRKTGLSVFEAIGTLYPLNAGASAKAVLSVLSTVEQNTIYASQLGQFTKKTITNVAQLKADIKLTQKLGYAVSDGETYEGVIGIAAPYSGINGWPIGSIAIAAPKSRLAAKQVAAYGEILKTAANKLSEMLKNPEA